MAPRSMPPRRFFLETSQVVFEKGALRQVTVEVCDGFAVLKLRGLQESFAVPWTAIYRIAAAREAERQLKARRAQFEL